MGKGTRGGKLSGEREEEEEEEVLGSRQRGWVWGKKGGMVEKAGERREQLPA